MRTCQEASTEFEEKLILRICKLKVVIFEEIMIKIAALFLFSTHGRFLLIEKTIGKFVQLPKFGHNIP